MGVLQAEGLRQVANVAAVDDLAGIVQDAGVKARGLGPALFGLPSFSLEETGAQIQTVCGEHQPHDQSGAAKNDDRLERFNIDLNSCCTGECVSKRSHRNLRR